MRKWIVLGAIVACLGGLGAVAAGTKLVNSPATADLGPCQTSPASETQPTFVVVIGNNASDAQLVPTHLRHLTQVVLPQAEAEHGRVVVGEIADDSQRDPTLVADISLLPSGDGSDNPENQADWAAHESAQLLSCVNTALAKAPANRSDVFGALAWAANVLPPQASDRHIVLLSDDINTTEGCNLTGRDISTSGRQRVADDCGKADYSGLAGTDVWLAGVGLSSGDDAATSLTPTTLTEFWSWFVASHGGRVSRAGATLLPGE
jgi:hypothetical protein